MLRKRLAALAALAGLGLCVGCASSRLTSCNRGGFFSRLCGRTRTVETVPTVESGSFAVEEGPSLAVDLKQKDGVEFVLRLLERSDALLEGFRPGVMERLGLGPHECWARNRRLVASFGSMTSGS